ncbi:MAG: hypothetical protein IT318_16090 [Anaerolineales bacterium]|nr:hypothetical protein [Anaerolineales bacterium]
MSQEVDMAQLARSTGMPERFFITREMGEVARRRLAEVVSEVPEGEALLLDFPANQLIDASFADECLIELQKALASGQFGNRGLVLKGLTDDSVLNIESAISLQDLKMAFLTVDAADKWKPIGRLEKSLHETLQLVARVGKLTAPELAKRRKLAINGASNRLKRLYDLRLVRREHEVSASGLQYIYSFWRWRPSDRGLQAEKDAAQ